LAAKSEKGCEQPATFNWNQICNCGMTVGALSVACEEPDIAREVVDAARGWCAAQLGRWYRREVPALAMPA
jgi:hypothetical protein